VLFSYGARVTLDGEHTASQRVVDAFLAFLPHSPAERLRCFIWDPRISPEMSGACSLDLVHSCTILLSVRISSSRFDSMCVKPMFALLPGAGSFFQLPCFKESCQFQTQFERMTYRVLKLSDACPALFCNLFHYVCEARPHSRLNLLLDC
jgi:hypothetical protein